ncbi:hypothetical protein K501DRAFT_331778 [Backusella circina FSU 941]|nr:hypothetical protein K501DRAFT_331778 [Backusella circina FSU 941]
MKTQSTGCNLARDVYSEEQKDVSIRQVSFKNKALKPLQSIENTAPSKQIKERSFIPSRYKTHHHYQQKNNEEKKQNQEPGTLSVIQHSFNSVNSPHRIELTKQRPTMGGKTIGAIRSDCTDKKRLSSQELKLLSRRIDPNEPLSSPHASPSKPPLPNLSRKRPRSPNVTSINISNNVNRNPRQFICEPCNKKYKNRNGLAYHQERCKYRKEQQRQQQDDNNIHCICLFPTAVTKPLVECKKCNTFLHQNCLGCEVQLQVEDYCCPRCDDKEAESHLLDNGTFINLSDLVEAKERGKNLLKNLKEAQESSEQDQVTAGNNNFDFVRLFADENNSTTEESAELQECDPIMWDPPSDLSGNWYFPDVPSLLFSSDACPSSALDDDSILPSDATFDLPSDFTISNNDLPSDLADFPSSPLQPDWLDFANFEDDFTC